MKSLRIETTKLTPTVILDPDAGKIEFKGISLPENLLDFYSPILQWLEDFIHILNAPGEREKYPALRITFKLSYYNSGSVRVLISILQKIKIIKNALNNAQIYWYYETEDLYILDNGKDLAELTGLEFNFIEVKE